MASVPALLLKRRGLVFAPTDGTLPRNDLVPVVEIELSQLGYALSTRLKTRLACLSVAELAQLQRWLQDVLAEQMGAHQRHVPLFRSFPNDIPDDMRALWRRKVVSHFLQATDQPCLFCRRLGTTHVLNPCEHVVCDRCFDGSNYTACPVCERPVDRRSPFFQATPERPIGKEQIRFWLLDVGESVEEEARSLFVSFCERKQAMSPDDVDAFQILLRHYREAVLAWLPEKIPVKENVAHVFGTLFQECGPEAVLPAARAHLATATDVLRLIAAYSGADPALQRQTVFRVVQRTEQLSRWWGPVAQLIGATPPGPQTYPVQVPVQLHRFQVARLRRPLRRALLSLLESMPPESMIEDVLRHRSYWVWVGQFLHPHEYAERFPNVARAFAVARKQAPDGTPAPPFQGFNGRVEAAARRGDAATMLRLLSARPGELARRFDQMLRVAGTDVDTADRVTRTFATLTPSFSTPVLLTLSSLLPTRDRAAAVRIFWPKGGAAKAPSIADTRPTLPRSVIGPAVRSIEAELLRRFGEKDAFGDCLIDAALRDIAVPFNERTASRSAVSLPRGSRVDIPRAKTVRLFLHWCEPEKGGETTDVDLSVAFYDSSWSYSGVCSYYQLKLDGAGGNIAVSAGDLRAAPFPDGATELVDLSTERALRQGIRYAVMVVNAYAGMPFSLLERAYAGVMLRDDVQGKHFDPRTVALKFALQGTNGVFLPLVLDLQENRLHWLDVYSRGQFEMNNVETSNNAITTICPELMGYFESGVRMSMYDLALLHAAARSQRVFVRGEPTRLFERQPGESAQAFLDRLKAGTAGRVTSLPAFDGAPVLALLQRGDVALPQGSRAYALFREALMSTVAASDFIL